MTVVEKLKTKMIEGNTHQRDLWNGGREYKKADEGGVRKGRGRRGREKGRRRGREREMEKEKRNV